MRITMLLRSLFLLVGALSTLVVADDYSHLLQCLTQGSDSRNVCISIMMMEEEEANCMWCSSIPAKNNNGKQQAGGLCVSNTALLASAFFTTSNLHYYQCSNTSSSDDDDMTPATDDDDYFPSADDDATFDDDAAATDDDHTPTTDDDANTNNDDIDTDDYNPYDDDDQSPSNNDDDQSNNDDDDGNSDDYMKKLLECLAVGNETACTKNTPTSCVWCTTSFGQGLCVSDEAGKDIDGYFYTCKWNTTSIAIATTSVEEQESEPIDSSVYDHYCWNAQDEAACEGEVDGRDLPCVWCDAHQDGGETDGTCLSQAQTNLVKMCQAQTQE